MKIYIFTFLISALFLTACSSSQPANQTANTTTANAANPTNAATNSSQPAETKVVVAKSPTEVMNALNEAAKTNDAATIKALISKGTMALLEESAKQQNTTVDELLQRDASMPFEEVPEMRNEQIAGDKATLDIKNTESGIYSSVPFVKEDGSWKIALDVYLKDVQEQMRKQMNEPANTKPPMNPKSSTKDKKTDKFEEKDLSVQD
ncbi:MAG TPA: hypothetical protein PKY59_09450 [Pyrinomonadaceae bacterium]|nr:hypothetical protein [Pyrinomonadaceae bacterium]